MNALAISPQGLGSIGLIGFNPALANVRAAAAPGVPATANGFTNLISALFGAIGESKIEPEAGKLMPAAKAAAGKIAPEKKIADAMIRSMLGARREAPKAKAPAANDARQDGANPANLQVVVTKATAVADDNAEITAAAAESKPVDPVNEAAAIAPQAPVAFSAVLTPVTNASNESNTTLGTAEAATAEAGPATKPELAAKTAAQMDLKPLVREEAPRVLAVAQAASSSNFMSDSFARAFESAAPSATPAQTADAKPVSTFGTIAQALRTSETPSAAAAPLNTSPIHDIAVRISHPDQPVVDLHIAERAGEIHVAVRTPDAPLANSLRQDLGTLTNSLERAGYRTETIVPRSAELHTAQPSKSSSQDERQQSSQRDAAGQDANSSSQGRQRRQRDRNLQNWFNEMEKQS